MGAEADQERRKRLHRRTLFDGVAECYAAYRLGRSAPAAGRLARPADDLRHHLQFHSEVHLTQHTTLTMARTSIPTIQLPGH
jgi:hypothetical protein